MAQWSVTNTGIERGEKVIRRPAGLTDYGWRKMAEAVCAELNAGSAAQLLQQEQEKLPTGAAVLWEPWQGGENPATPPDRWVQVILRDGFCLAKRANGLRWLNEIERLSDIVFWRYCSHEEAPGGHWNMWGSGSCPTAPDNVVEVVLRNGVSNKAKAKLWEWKWAGGNHPGEILYWRHVP